ncbi:MAG: ribonuclease H-like domain-containing protein [Candidatus Eisenbacteria bacterium]
MATAPDRNGIGQEDLLELGVRRYLAGVTYDIPENAYARILHPPFATRPPASGGETASRMVETDRTFAPLEEAARLCGDGVLVIDIESLGFVGRPVFLIGGLHVRAEEETGAGALRGRIIQYLARDYSEEQAMLRAFLSESAACPLWVSFNGRTFDVPSLAVRTAFHRLALPVPGIHLDLLPVARRLWGQRLPDCRLQTLEHQICGRPRGEDIPGSRIPTAYHEYVRNGEPWEMIQILRHNAADLLTLWRVLQEACAELPSPSSHRGAEGA